MGLGQGNPISGEFSVNVQLGYKIERVDDFIDIARFSVLHVQRTETTHRLRSSGICTTIA